ncbi:helix-turn-helix domain-containing protein [Actinokineospora spheciospongiae]|uniref:helix-turn-helix domain-containing protein n=1 Tax=Actinokineospora spheciospongiae TaxID=909613 RepID=UPI000D94C2EA|nr:helix-turn-helix transcriptional regulator [Actinokineospora spheciospongiae]PWW65443.1 helix-turn-helix protein [Actinokineospora spheciospongiae]
MENIAAMPGNSHTSVRSRTVAAELRRLREARGLSCAEVGEKLGASASKISRMETGHSGLQVEDVAALLGFYEVSAKKRTELLDLLKRGDQKGWWERQANLPTIWRAVIDFENKATRIQNFEAIVVPGLLQTDEYAAALLRGTNPTLSGAELDNLVATRMARHSLLIGHRAPQYVACIHESALRIPVGGSGVMVRQLRRLIDLGERANITIRVVPSGSGAHAGLRGSFMILEFAEEPALVYMENQATGLFLEEEADLAGYRLALHNILSEAVAPDATETVLAALITELTK